MVITDLATGINDANARVEVGQKRNLASMRQSLFVLALAAGLLLLANGRNTIPIAAWLALLFLLRFVRSQGVGSLHLCPGVANIDAGVT